MAFQVSDSAVLQVASIAPPADVNLWIAMGYFWGVIDLHFMLNTSMLMCMKILVFTNASWYLQMYWDSKNNSKTVM